jgi:hypothetical protein
MKPMNRLSLLLASLAVVTIAACDVAPGSDGKVYDVGVTTSALHDAFTTSYQADVATAITSNRVFNVWIAQTSTGDQVVGQMFDLSTGAPIGASRVYTNTTHRKYMPSVSYGPLGRFLIAYVDAYSSTDDDILGIIVDNTGALVSSMTIDFSTNFNIEPQVTFVPTGINQWLVTYQQSGSTEAVLAAYVDSAGNHGNPVTITTSTQEIVSPMSQYSISTQRLMFAWGEGAGSNIRFASTSLALGPISALPFHPSHDVMWPTIAYQPNTESMGIAFFDQVGLIDSTAQVRLLVLPRGCESVSCASAERSTGISVAAPITGVGRGFVTALGSSFVIQNPISGSFVNGETIRLTALDGNSGAPGLFTNQSIPGCSAALVGGDYGGAGTSITVSSTAAADRISMIYDAFCPTTSKVRAQFVNTSLTRTSYVVSD